MLAMKSQDRAPQQQPQHQCDQEEPMTYDAQSWRHRFLAVEDGSGAVLSPSQQYLRRCVATACVPVQRSHEGAML